MVETPHSRIMALFGSHFHSLYTCAKKMVTGQLIFEVAVLGKLSGKLWTLFWSTCWW